MDMQIELSNNLKTKPKWGIDELGFGKIFTDHMLTIDYNPDKGWHHARITPYAPLTLDPASCCLHYGQLVFEGLKAYKNANGGVTLFRAVENMARLNESSQRMCIPTINPTDLLSALSKLVEIEKDWVPPMPGASLYIRPMIIATDVALAVYPSHTYRLIVILSPVAAYYKGGMAPLLICVDTEYVRATKGGTGEAKCAGNYAASLRSQVTAQGQGFAQVLWLDGLHRKYIEEVGTMNVFFVIDNVAVTPQLSGSILPGVTRKSVIDILKGWNIPTEERPITIDELAAAYTSGRLEEAFGTGTAAVISPIGELTWGNTVMKLSGGNVGKLTQQLYDEVTGIQYGTRPDTRGWVQPIQ